MIFILLVFMLLIIGLALMMSYELRLKANTFAQNIWPMGKTKFVQLGKLARQLNHATLPQATQQYWHIQQWWAIVAGFSLLFMLMIVASTRKVDSTRIEADYLKKVDPQIYSLLHGEILTPPPDVDEQLINAAIVDASQSDQYRAQSEWGQTDELLSDNDQSHRYTFNTQFIDRKWNRINPRYKQRLLMVFKIMKERYQYDLVLIEGYRSPERQNLLSKQPETTKARAYQSYHQFGLAADVAFIRDGKVMISERDPWVMQAYQRYGEVAESVGLTWGGRWKSIQDYGHTEFRLPGLEKTQAMAEQLSKEGQLMTTQLEKNESQ